MKPVLVTGASGNVGGLVLRALTARGMPCVAAAPEPTRLAETLPPATRTVTLDLRDDATWAGATQGMGSLFLVRPPAIADVAETLNPFVDAARAQGVEHVVFLSVAGAGRNRFVPHRKVEDHLRARGVHHTNLRPGFFAQNLQTAYRDDIVRDGRIYVPAGQRKPVNWIDCRDIAEVAALVLAEPHDHRGRSYTLTGPGPVPWSEVTRALSTVLDRPIRYEAASVLGYVRHLARRELPAGAIAVQTILHVLLRFGQGRQRRPDPRAPARPSGRSISDYVEDHAFVWRPDSEHDQ